MKRSPSPHRIARISLALVLSICCALALSACWGFGNTQATTDTTTVEVPDVTGMTEDEAAETLEDAGLKKGKVTTKASSKVKKGLVMSQSPKAASEQEEGTKVNLVISSGTEEDELVEEPDVVGKTQKEATSTLKEAGFEVSVKKAASSEVAKGVVISQSPSAGSKLVKGEKITIVVSKGEEQKEAGTEDPAKPEESQNDENTNSDNNQSGQDMASLQASSVAVPYVAYLTLDDAILNMDLAGLGHTVDYAYSDTVAYGYTIGTNPAGGSLVAPGSTVTIIVSEGTGSSVPSTTTVPSVVGNDEASATSQLYAAGFGVYVEYRYDVAPATQVIAQTPAGWSEAAPGSYVTITVSEGPAPEGAVYS